MIPVDMATTVVLVVVWVILTRKLSSFATAVISLSFLSLP